jgi:hypothetical protein
MHRFLHEQGLPPGVITVERDNLTKNVRDKAYGQSTDVNTPKPVRTSYADIMRKGTKRTMKVSFLESERRVTLLSLSRNNPIVRTVSLTLIADLSLRKSRISITTN